MSDDSPRESGGHDESNALDDIMSAADRRDEDADARDHLADGRDMDAARTGAGPEDFATRTQASSDRLDAKLDRVASRRDRDRMQGLTRTECAVPECHEPAQRGETVLGKNIMLTDAAGHEFAVPDQTVVSYTAPVCARHSIQDVLDLG